MDTGKHSIFTFSSCFSLICFTFSRKFHRQYFSKEVPRDFSLVFFRLDGRGRFFFDSAAELYNAREMADEEFFQVFSLPIFRRLRHGGFYVMSRGRTEHRCISWIVKGTFYIVLVYSLDRNSIWTVFRLSSNAPRFKELVFASIVKFPQSLFSNAQVHNFEQVRFGLHRYVFNADMRIQRLIEKWIPVTGE